MKRLTILSAACLLIAGTAAAPAQTGFGTAQGAGQRAQMAQNFLAMWDLDGDGKVTPAEAREHRGDVFAMFDSDGDGSFSAEEIAGIGDFRTAQQEANGAGPATQRIPALQGLGGQGGMTQRQIARLDSNRDNRISQSEFVAGTDAWFAMRDRNGDGVLTVADFGPRR
ncbi:EF-hand domain-containing protein [Rhodobacter maris]|uniref:EF hand domain-containing protein n=1 Tax=Rhodobacter maris TaxID=446682 RepID=A0A285RP86_9RHOB|nr:calcium-binding protein [Rhodobacter maris]SOB94137.1 EF hand domain-containing protein [Rhodobacter maris]